MTVKGHRTSVALEAEFWAVIDALADTKGVSVSQLITDTDLSRENGLASTLRVLALKTAQATSG